MTVALSIDPTKLGVRPERYPVVRAWLKMVAIALETSMEGDSTIEDMLTFGTSQTLIKHKPVKTDADE